ncbi:hypothetical protein [uncultured Kocuria sp.]|uniref:hypothetical protein n=1 Tax=uncultured Kocuria sp. TaxID=259305 RepID=UPI0025964C90|nr:hypothetical protein [uncultured Kocuria sp.]MCT1368399.1 hypothetical protein [Rothia sp. p3-SID1597]
MNTNATEQNNLNVDGFNLADWLAGGTEHRLRQTVTIYRDASLSAEVDRIEKQMDAAAKAPEGMEPMGETSTAELEQKKQDLLNRMESAKAEVEVYALIDPELRECREALGDKPTNYNYADDETYWYEVLSRAATLQGRKLTVDQWRAVHQTIGAQFVSLVQGYANAVQADISPRFRR